MKIKDVVFFKTIKNFLTVYLPKQKCLSPNTIKSYREAINLLLLYLQEEKGMNLYSISFSTLDYKTLSDFLDWLENKRNCSVSTRNQRLMSLKSFYKYAGIMEVSQISSQMEIQKIPIKKAPYTIVDFLSENCLKTLLEQANTSTNLGIRNQVFMILMYDTAARCQELLDLKVKDFELNAKNPYVYLTGKGSKTRSVPIAEKTLLHLKRYLKLFHSNKLIGNEEYLFYTVIHKQRNKMSPDTVANFIKKYGESARKSCCDIPKRVHPHQLRHTRAIHLYRGGMPLALLSEFLGHASPASTQIYAYSDTEMKRAAIQKANSKNSEIVEEEAIWKDDKEMLLKLYGLK